MSTDAVCSQIRAAYAGLTRSERRVADVVLANPGAALDTATARLAEAARVSQPQVIRFCRAVGFDGVKSLKRALAQGSELPGGHPLLARSLQALVHVDRARLAEAAQHLAQARQIDVLADTARAPLLDLALRTLWRMGLPARPLQAGDAPGAAACLSLGAATATGILIAETHRPDTAALQLITGPESAAAPTLLAALMLQLLLAELPAASSMAEHRSGAFGRQPPLCSSSDALSPRRNALRN